MQFCGSMWEILLPVSIVIGRKVSIPGVPVFPAWHNSDHLSRNLVPGTILSPSDPVPSWLYSSGKITAAQLPEKL